MSCQKMVQESIFIECILISYIVLKIYRLLRIIVLYSANGLSIVDLPLDKFEIIYTALQ